MKVKYLLKKIVNNFLLSPFNLRIYSTEAFGRDLVNDTKKLIGSPKVMLDVGANVGQTVNNWLDQFDNPEIHSFEPVNRLFNELSSKHEHNAVCNNLGVGSEKTNIRINYGKHDVSHSFVHSDDGRGGEIAEVVTLDDYCRENNLDHVSFLKIDVEGFEYEVIKGANSLLSEARVDLISVELGVDPTGYYIHYPDFANKLLEYGYFTVGFYDQTCNWDGSAKLLFCNVLFSRPNLMFQKK